MCFFVGGSPIGDLCFGGSRIGGLFSGGGLTGGFLGSFGGSLLGDLTTLIIRNYTSVFQPIQLTFEKIKSISRVSSRLSVVSDLLSVKANRLEVVQEYEVKAEFQWI